jgi:hypothetical protein
VVEVGTAQGARNGEVLCLGCVGDLHKGRGSGVEEWESGGEGLGVSGWRKLDGLEQKLMH